MIAAQGDTLSREEEDVDVEPADPEVFHYVRKADMARSAIQGTTVKALCGEEFEVRKVPKKSPVVCYLCKELFGILNP